MNESATGLSRVAVALDTNDSEEFERWCAMFGPRVGVLKVGLQAFVKWGPVAVETARAHAGSVFLDLKLHDIPNTVAGAVREVAELGVDYVTVHAGGGPAMMRAAAAAAGDRVKILAVTLLTHLDDGELGALDLGGTSEARVRGWAALARKAGCAGVVCSPLEVERLRGDNPRPFGLVTPGIRFNGVSSADDQRRVAGPTEALALGSDLLVIGRPLTRAADPAQALSKLTEILGV